MVLQEILGIVLVALFFLYRHVTRNFNYWKVRNIPFVKPTVLFGNAYKIFMQKESIGQFLHKIHKQTDSPYLGFFGFDQPFLLIRTPELVKTVLVRDFEYFHDRSVTTNTTYDVIGRNILFVINNPEWKPLRNGMTPAFSTGKLKQMVVLMEDVGKDLVDALKRDYKTGNICVYVGKYATDLVASCAFGINARSLHNEQSEFRHMVERVFDNSIIRAISRGCCFFAPFLVKMFGLTFVDSKAATWVNKVFYQVVNDREASNTVRNDLIDIVVKTRKKHENSGQKIDNDRMLAQCTQYLFAGVETAETTLALALYELAINLDVQSRLRDEIIEYIGDKPLNYENIQSMKYIDMVIKETLRKHPILPYLDRRCAKEWQLPGTDVTIDKGVPVYISLFGFQLDPEYFPEPEKFIPERFSEENLNSMTSYLYMPFGLGPRNCPGEKFALVSIKIGLIKILQNFEILTTTKTPIPPKFKTQGIVIVPDEEFHLEIRPLKNIEGVNQNSKRKNKMYSALNFKPKM